MSNILSNRFFQGGLAIAAIGIAFFAYQNIGAEEADTTAATTEAPAEAEAAANVTTTTGETEDNSIQEAVNNTTETDNINSAGEETITND